MDVTECYSLQENRQRKNSPKKVSKPRGLDNLIKKLTYTEGPGATQILLCAAQISLSSIITAKFSAAKLWKAQFWSHLAKRYYWAHTSSTLLRIDYVAFSK